ncbi:hypothetical protein BH10ACT7_BH10ACT7_00040 [soil metagenome]
MRSAHTVVLERNTPIVGTFHTEPYEVGWATEAIWYVDALDPLDAEWTLVVEISPDGLRWCALDDSSHPLASSGLTAIRVTHFGTWLRIGLTPSVAAATARLLVTLSLK